MAKKSEKGESSDTVSVSKRSVRCVGSVCYDPVTDKVQIHLDEKCERSDLEDIGKRVMSGTEVEFVLPKKKQ